MAFQTAWWTQLGRHLVKIVGRKWRGGGCDGLPSLEISLKSVETHAVPHSILPNHTEGHRLNGPVCLPSYMVSQARKVTLCTSYWLRYNLKSTRCGSHFNFWTRNKIISHCVSPVFVLFCASSCYYKKLLLPKGRGLKNFELILTVSWQTI